jgi:hypothetical protein
MLNTDIYIEKALTTEHFTKKEMGKKYYIFLSFFSDNHCNTNFSEA